MEKNLNPITDIGGASESAPQIRPVFSYAIDGGGLILVYVFQTEVTNVAVVAFDDGYSEEAYAVSSLHSANTGINLVYDAVQRFQEIALDTPNNPFRQLAQDKEAMQRLNNLLASIFWGE